MYELKRLPDSLKADNDGDVRSEYSDFADFLDRSIVIVPQKDLSDILRALVTKKFFSFEEVSQEKWPYRHYVYNVTPKGRTEAAMLARRILKQASSRSSPAGQIKRAEEIDINELIRRELRGLYVKRKLFFPEEGLPKIIGNLGKLIAAFMELFGNAVEAITGTEKSLLSVSTKTVSSESMGPCVEITILDNGPGIHPDKINCIFDKGFTTKVNMWGGLGLYTAKKIIESHGGTIEVESKHVSQHPTDHGTTFTITLPTRTSPTDNAETFAQIRERVWSAYRALIKINPNVTKEPVDFLERMGRKLGIATGDVIGTRIETDILKKYFGPGVLMNPLLTVSSAEYERLASDTDARDELAQLRIKGPGVYILRVCPNPSNSYLSIMSQPMGYQVICDSMLHEFLKILCEDSNLALSDAEIHESFKTKTSPVKDDEYIQVTLHALNVFSKNEPNRYKLVDEEGVKTFYCIIDAEVMVPVFQVDFYQDPLRVSIDRVEWNEKGLSIDLPDNVGGRRILFLIPAPPGVTPYEYFREALEVNGIVLKLNMRDAMNAILFDRQRLGIGLTLHNIMLGVEELEDFSKVEKYYAESVTLKEPLSISSYYYIEAQILSCLETREQIVGSDIEGSFAYVVVSIEGLSEQGLLAPQEKQELLDRLAGLEEHFKSDVSLLEDTLKSVGEKIEGLEVDLEGGTTSPADSSQPGSKTSPAEIEWLIQPIPADWDDANRLLSEDKDIQKLKERIGEKIYVVYLDEIEGPQITVVDRDHKWHSRARGEFGKVLSKERCYMLELDLDFKNESPDNQKDIIEHELYHAIYPSTEPERKMYVLLMAAAMSGIKDELLQTSIIDLMEGFHDVRLGQRMIAGGDKERFLSYTNRRIEEIEISLKDLRAQYAKLGDEGRFRLITSVAETLLLTAAPVTFDGDIEVAVKLRDKIVDIFSELGMPEQDIEIAEQLADRLGIEIATSEIYPAIGTTYEIVADAVREAGLADKFITEPPSKDSILDFLSGHNTSPVTEDEEYIQATLYALNLLVEGEQNRCKLIDEEGIKTFYLIMDHGVMVPIFQVDFNQDILKDSIGRVEWEKTGLRLKLPDTVRGSNFFIRISSPPGVNAYEHIREEMEIDGILLRWDMDDVEQSILLDEQGVDMEDRLRVVVGNIERMEDFAKLEKHFAEDALKEGCLLGFYYNCKEMIEWCVEIRKRIDIESFFSDAVSFLEEAAGQVSLDPQQKQELLDRLAKLEEHFKSDVRLLENALEIVNGRVEEAEVDLESDAATSPAEAVLSQPHVPMISEVGHTLKRDWRDVIPGA